MATGRRRARVLRSRCCDRVLGVTDSRIEKWRRRIDGRISSDVHTMHLHRHTLSEVRGIVESNTDLPDSYFFEYLTDTYATTQAVAVRRQADNTPRVVTLGRPDHRNPR